MTQFEVGGNGLGLVSFFSWCSCLSSISLQASHRSRWSIAFGGTFPVLWSVLIMFIGVVLGTIANYIWIKPSSFSWLDFLRPVVISPLILLPLIGSLQGSPLEPI